jgi:6-phosphogluconolactonase
VRVLRDASEVTERAQREILARAKLAIRARGAFRIALSGGATPRALYERLAAAAGVEWSRWHVFFGDERCVPPHHADSNAGMVCEALLDRVPIPSRQVHRMRGEAEPVAAAAEYERTLLEHFGGPPRFDLVLLGLGADGHTASLFPGSSALAERERAVVATFVESLRAWRITLTQRAIAGARCAIFLVTGADKAVALAEALRERRSPAGEVALDDGEILWLADRAAASRLDVAPSAAEDDPGADRDRR